MPKRNKIILGVVGLIVLALVIAAILSMTGGTPVQVVEMPPPAPVAPVVAGTTPDAAAAITVAPASPTSTSLATSGVTAPETSSAPATAPLAPEAQAPQPASPQQTPPVQAAAEPLIDIPQELRDAITNDFKDKLSFPLDEAKMATFVKSANRVKRINAKWDVQIAASETDSMAIEYNNFAVEEITNALKTMPGLTVDQYNELTRLTTTDTNFNRVYMLYKQLLDAAKAAAQAQQTAGISPAPAVGSTAPVDAATAPAGAIPSPPAPGTGIPVPAAGVPAAAPVTAAPAPAVTGIAPAPQGSPAPVYSPPVSPQ